MRTAAIAPVLALVLASPALALADGTSFDLGYVRSRVGVTDQTALDANMVRFAIRLDVDQRIKYFHFGVEAEEGSLHGTTSLTNGAVARIAPGEMQPGTTQPLGPESPLYGNVLALKTVVGIHANTQLLRVSADLGGGFRDAWVESDQGTDVAGRKGEALLEVRSRLDVRVSPRLLVGMTATTDLIEKRDVSVGIVLAFDASR